MSSRVTAVAASQGMGAQVVGYELYEKLRAYLIAHCRTLAEVRCGAGGAATRRGAEA